MKFRMTPFVTIFILFLISCNEVENIKEKEAGLCDTTYILKNKFEGQEVYNYYCLKNNLYSYFGVDLKGDTLYFIDELTKEVVVKKYFTDNQLKDIQLSVKTKDGFKNNFSFLYKDHDVLNMDSSAFISIKRINHKSLRVTLHDNSADSAGFIFGLKKFPSIFEFNDNLEKDSVAKMEDLSIILPADFFESHKKHVIWAFISTTNTSYPHGARPFYLDSSIVNWYLNSNIEDTAATK